MKAITKFYKAISLLSVIALVMSCERDLSSDAVLATYPTTGEIFIEAPVAMGSDFYLPYANSKPTAFSIDEEVGYESSRSIRIDVPNANDPEGSYAGAILRVDGVGRDLSGYDALTFYAKASVGGAVLNQVGFGEDFGENKFLVTRENVALSTNWVKYVIPIPDASKLVNERGMLRYAASGIGSVPGSEVGYTFWLDDIKFEKLGTVAQPRPKILNGEDVSEVTFIGASLNLTGLTETFNTADGSNVTVVAAPAYYTISSSDTSVAGVNSLGEITVSGAGTTVLTASLGGIDAQGSLTIESLGEFASAPIPTFDAANVISIFSDTYTNVPVDFYNGYWQPYQTTESADFVVNGDNVLNYTNFNFVGTSFANPTVNASEMTNVHFNIFIPGTLDANSAIKITIRDFGPNGVDGGGDDSNQTIIVDSSTLMADAWATVDVPLSLANSSNVGLLIYENSGSVAVSNFYLDNVLFYKEQTAPTVAAPTPTQDPANVISIYSDAYTAITGINYNPGWGQMTQYSEEAIDGNNTIVYTGLNYQGIDFSGNAQDLTGKTHLHIDYFSVNSTALNAYIISPGPVETAKALTVPTNGQWMSVDIPLSDFSPVDITNVIQMKFDGNGDIYIDNIYFY